MGKHSRVESKLECSGELYSGSELTWTRNMLPSRLSGREFRVKGESCFAYLPP
jgi:hypothetical protein